MYNKYKSSIFKNAENCSATKMCPNKSPSEEEAYYFSYIKSDMGLSIMQHFPRDLIDEKRMLRKNAIEKADLCIIQQFPPFFYGNWHALSRPKIMS